MSGQRLYKKEKLCSVIAISKLFAGNDADCASALCYPLRAVWRPNPGRASDAQVQFLVSIPKKRVRHAVDRVLMRRRVREAYRRNRHLLNLSEGARIDVAFMYVGKTLCDYARVEAAMQKILARVSSTPHPANAPTEP